MENAIKALRIAGVAGVVCGAIGYVGFFVGGDLGAFTGGATPGSMLGFSLLVLRVMPEDADK